MTVIIEDSNDLPNELKFKFQVGDVTYLIVKRGKIKNANEKPVRVYSDTDHSFMAETLCKNEEHSHSQDLIPLVDF